MKIMPLYNKRGSTLLIALFVLILLIGFTTILALRTVHKKNMVERERDETLALHTAEAGIEEVIYDLRKDYVNDSTDPSWSDGDINGMAIGPDSDNFYSVPYSSTSINGGYFEVSLKNTSSGDNIWIRSTGTIGSVTQTLEVYARLYSLSPWENAIFGGAGASGTSINGNVDIRGSVHILGNGLASGEHAINLGGTAELVGNNYSGLDAGLAAKIPALPTTVFNGETVETLNAELRVKKGLVGLSGSSTVGEADNSGDGDKETVDGAYVTDGYDGSGGASSVYSDNGTSQGYDLGEAVSFPSLSNPYNDGGTLYSSYQAYLNANALVITDAAELATLAAIDPNSNFSFSDAKGTISMDGSGNMSISGIVYIGDDITPADLNMAIAGSDKTITYTGSGSVLVTGNTQIDVNLVTSGNSSYPTNIVGIMTPGDIGFNAAGIDVMGIFFAEGKVVAQKQTNVIGTLVTNYFDMGTNVPSIYQVPEVAENLPTGMIAGEGVWLMKIVSWQKI